jgi:hypothetical protein
VFGKRALQAQSLFMEFLAQRMAGQVSIWHYCKAGAYCIVFGSLVARRSSHFMSYTQKCRFRQRETGI